MMPAAGGPEPMGRVAFSPDDASPSRARLGRVAAMLREAEEAAPVPARRRPREPGLGAVVPLVRRRARTARSAPRVAGDEVPTARAVAGRP